MADIWRGEKRKNRVFPAGRGGEGKKEQADSGGDRMRTRWFKIKNANQGAKKKYE